MSNIVIARRGFIGGLATSLCGLVTVKAGTLVAEPMTLDRACEVLTKAKHHHCEWRSGVGSTGPTAYGLGMDWRDLSMWTLTGFEAIAIAEKYEREHISENQASYIPTVELTGQYRESVSIRLVVSRQLN
jgi:hypothetical protein